MQVFTSILAVALLVLWFLGIAGFYTLGWYVYPLIVATAVLFLVGVMRDEYTLG